MKWIIATLYRVIKKSDINIDVCVPNKYLLSLLVEKILDRIRGALFFGPARKVFLAKKCVIKAKSMVKFDGVCVISRECKIDALSTNGIRFGNNVSIGQNTGIKGTGSLVKLGVGCRIGDNVGIGDGSFLGCAGGIDIGDDVILGNCVSMHSENHNYSRVDIPIRKQGTSNIGIKIGNNCWIGAKATILDGVTLGSGCIVGAGAIVTRGKYPDNSVIVGIPAKVVKMRIE